MDAAEYEEIAGSPVRSLSLSFREREMPHIWGEESELELCDTEVLDELISSRGELKLRTSSFNEDKPFQARGSLIISLSFMYMFTHNPRSFRTRDIDNFIIKGNGG
ncbi:hypothetical protein BVC80_8855g26 [Macleaya cordata]|uniref:Uncharacterized protein n=1 Tax=Macleaya cordata TaxID=56857 RepID=A0A200PY50_MACCD|nr:hypothetical protein BVC80_8855g26 [Macleaya cordata]